MAQPQHPMLEQLVRASGELDRVIADLQLGHPSRRTPHADIDAIRDRVEALAAALRATARGPARRPTAAPLWTNGAGRAAW